MARRADAVARVVCRVRDAAAVDDDGVADAPPFIDLLLGTAELRDLFLLEHLEQSRSASSTRSGSSGNWRSVSRPVQAPTWAAVARWTVSLYHPPASDAAAAVGWCLLPEAARAFVVAWQLKRFVGGFASCSGEGLLALRSGSAGGAVPTTPEAARCAGDDRLFAFDGVWLLESECGRTFVDTRVWEAVLSSSGNEHLLNDLPMQHVEGGGGGVPSRTAMRSDARLVVDVEYSASDFIGPSGARQAAVGTLSSFETLLWLTCYYALIVGATSRPGRRRDTDSESMVLWLTSAVGHVRYAVHQVVRAWNAVARGVGFVDMEEMARPYLLWCPADFCYAPLCRPLDHNHLFVPQSQRWSLYCRGTAAGPGSALSADAADEAAAQRHPLADAQLRAAASMFMSHLQSATSVASLEHLVHDGGGDVRPLRPRSTARLGRLSVAHYTRPAWRRSLSATPPILDCTVAGLTAFQSVAIRSRSPGGGRSGVQDPLLSAAGDPLWSSDEEEVAGRGTRTDKTAAGHSRGSRPSGRGRGTGTRSFVSGGSSSSSSRGSGGSSTGSSGESSGDSSSGSSSSSSSSSSSNESSSGSSSSSSTSVRTSVRSGGSSRGSRGRVVAASFHWKPSRLEKFRLLRRAVERQAGRAAASMAGPARSNLCRLAARVPAHGASPSVPAAIDGDGGGALSELATARGILEWAMPSVFRLYECRADGLLGTHAVAEATGRANRAAGRGAPPGLVHAATSSSSTTTAREPDSDRVSAGGGVGETPTSGAHLLASWPPLAGNVQVMLTDPPYNTRRKARMQRSDYDVLTDEDAKSFVDLCRVLLRPGGHVLIFCAWEQVNMWVRLLRACVDQVVVSAPRRADDTARVTSVSPPAFAVNSHPMYALRAVNGRVSRGRTSTLSSNMSEVIVVAQRCGAQGAAAHVMVNYRSFGCVPSRFRAFDNVIDNVPDVLQDEAIVAVDDDGKEFKVRAEQKSVALISELIQRYSQPGDIVADTFCGTCTTGDAAMSIPGGQHRRVILCDAFPDALDGGGRERLRNVFVEQAALGGFARLLGDASDQVRAAAAVVLAAERHDGLRVSAARPPADVGVGRLARTTRQPAEESRAILNKRRCAPPAGLPAHTAVPRSVLMLLASVFAREADEQRHALGGAAHPRAPPTGRVVALEVLQLVGQPLDAWPPRLRVAFCTADSVVMREQGAAVSGLFIAQSSLTGGSAGLGLFAGRDLPQGAVVGPFFGALLYGNFGALRVKSALYAPQVLGCHAPSPAVFSTRAMQLGDVRVAAPAGRAGVANSAADSGGAPSGPDPDDSTSHYPAWVCPSPFCWVAYANDPRATSPVERGVRGALDRAGGPSGSTAALSRPDVGGSTPASGSSSYKANLRCVLKQEAGLVSIDQLVDPFFCQLVTTCPVVAGSELLLDYGTDYDFGQAASLPGANPMGGDEGRASTTPHTFVATVV